MALILLIAYAIFITGIAGVSIGRRAGMEKEIEDLNHVVGGLVKGLESAIVGGHNEHVIREMSRDMVANLNATRTVADTLVGIRDAINRVPKSERTPEFYVRQLEYARDNYAADDKQRTAIDKVIKHITSNQKKV